MLLNPPEGETTLAWLLPAVLFGPAFLATHHLPRRWPGLLVQTLCTLGVVGTGGGLMGASGLIAVAAQAGLSFEGNLALRWSVLQTIAVTVLFALRSPPRELVQHAVAFASFQVFALAASRLARREATAREALAATQSRLLELSRTEERLHIARELHDSVGHQLVALSLALEVRREEPELAQARALARDAYRELRRAVEVLRVEPIDLEAALRQLVAQLAPLRVSLDVVPLGPLDATRAHALLRCAQEAVSNVLRHARASRLSLSLTREGTDLVLRAEDDGVGVGTLAPGHGLTGMAERVSALGGTLTFPARSRGFALAVTLPAGDAP